MNKKRILAGLDVGHVNTKAIIMRGEEILGYCTEPTGFDPVVAAEGALKNALKTAGVAGNELAGMVATGDRKSVV